MRIHLFALFCIIATARTESVNYFIGDEPWCDYSSIQSFVDNPPISIEQDSVKLLLEPISIGHKVHMFLASNVPALFHKNLEIAGVTGNNQDWDYDYGHEVVVTDYFHLNGVSLSSLIVRFLKFADIPQIDQLNPLDYQNVPLVVAENNPVNPVYIPASVITNCMFSNVNKTNILALTRRPGYPMTIISNNLIVNCSGQSFFKPWTYYDGYFMYNNTFHANQYTLATIGRIGHFHVIANNLFTANSINGTQHHALAPSGDGGDPPLIGYNISTDPYASLSLPLEGDFDPFIHPYSNTIFLEPSDWESYVKYADISHGNLEPSFASVCIDAGTTTLTQASFPLLVRDFDLTQMDIGWKPVLPIRKISGSQTNELSRASYFIFDHAVIGASIEPGSVFKVASGKQLLFRGTPDQNFSRCIGDIDGPRTAIVGRPEHNADPAAVIAIQNWAHDDLAQLHLEGVLFNYAPKSGDATDLWFVGWQPGWCEGPRIDGEKVQFMHYVDVPLPSGGSYDGGLLLNECTGSIQNHTFGQEHGPAWLKLWDCRTDVTSNTFVPQGDDPCLHVFGVLPGPSPSLLDNSFTATAGNPQLSPMMEAQGGVMNLRRNRFQDCQTTAVNLVHSSLHAAQEARNDFRANSSSFMNNRPLIEMEGGYLNLYCGRNNIIVYHRDVDWPVISWMQDTSQTQAVMTWRENFWGTSCQAPISQAELNNRNLALIPPWATVEDNLGTCVHALTPANPLCPFETNTPQQLLQQGIAAEVDGNLPLAQDNYRALLWLWAAKHEANEGSLRLKALGLHKTHGPEAYELVREDLFTAADSSASAKLSNQEVLQRCSGWCVEARWGDRSLANQSLNTMLADETDKINQDTIRRALLEIATYPPQGGMLATDGEAAFAQVLDRQAAATALMSYKGGHVDVERAAAPDLPQAFEIARVHPNPFNARVTIELAFPRDGQARVRVVNLLGQVVHTVLDQPVSAGRLSSSLDASRWSSGLYFVVAEHEGVVLVRKMTLLK